MPEFRSGAITVLTAVSFSDCRLISTTPITRRVLL